MVRLFDEKVGISIQLTNSTFIPLSEMVLRIIRPNGRQGQEH